MAILNQTQPNLILPDITLILTYDQYSILSRKKSSESKLDNNDFLLWGNDSASFLNAFLASQIWIPSDEIDIESPLVINERALFSTKSNKYQTISNIRKALVSLIDYQFDKAKSIDNSIFNTLKNKGEIDFGQGTINLEIFDPKTIRDLVPAEFWFFLRKGRIEFVLNSYDPGYTSQIVDFLNIEINKIESDILTIQNEQIIQNQAINANTQKNHEQDVQIEFILNEIDESPNINSNVIVNFSDDLITDTTYIFENEKIINNTSIQIQIKNLEDDILSTESIRYIDSPNQTIFLNTDGQSDPIGIQYILIDHIISIIIPISFSLKQISLFNESGYSINNFNINVEAETTSQIHEINPLSPFNTLSQIEINLIGLEERGNIDDLTTTDTSSLTNAINELKGLIDANTTSINSLNSGLSATNSLVSTNANNIAKIVETKILFGEGIVNQGVTFDLVEDFKLFKLITIKMSFNNDPKSYVQFTLDTQLVVLNEPYGFPLSINNIPIVFLTNTQIRYDGDQFDALITVEGIERK